MNLDDLSDEEFALSVAEMCESGLSVSAEYFGSTPEVLNAIEALANGEARSADDLSVDLYLRIEDAKNGLRECLELMNVSDSGAALHPSIGAASLFASSYERLATIGALMVCIHAKATEAKH